MRDADGGCRLCRSHLPHGAGQRHRQPDRAGHQDFREPADRAHDERAHRPRRLGHPAPRADDRRRGRRADRHDHPHRQWPHHLRRGARPPRVRDDEALSECVTQGRCRNRVHFRHRLTLLIVQIAERWILATSAWMTTGLGRPAQSTARSSPVLVPGIHASKDRALILYESSAAKGSLEPSGQSVQMKITRIREATAPIASEIRNAYISFTAMTVSLVAVETDVIRDGEPVIGYGFLSNGRYAQGGILRERFIPRLMEADPSSLIDRERDNLDPFAIWRTFMANEKPGGHGDRAHAAGALDMAVWDAVAKIAGQPLWRLLADRFNGGRFDEKVLVYPGGGYYYPGKELEGLKAEMRGYQEQGYRVVKMKIGGADLALDLKRIEAVLEVVGRGENLAVDANGRFDLDTALAYGHAMEPYGLFWYEEPGDPLDYQLNAVLAEHY